MTWMERDRIAHDILHLDGTVTYPSKLIITNHRECLRTHSYLEVHVEWYTPQELTEHSDADMSLTVYGKAENSTPLRMSSAGSNNYMRSI